MHEERFRDPSKETSLWIQDDKETLKEKSKPGHSPWCEGDCLDGFILEKKLGSGRSGVVFRALDTATERRCALKLLKPQSSDDLLRNKLGFRRMIPIVHPNLLRTDRIYQLGSCIALSMEEVKGVTFSEAIKQYRKMNLSEAYADLLRLLRDFATGLDVMHSNELLHRDIKPDNLMVDESGRGRIIDYGLVESFSVNRNAFHGSNVLVGTPHFFPPEVICSQRYLPAGDIFSLGISILEAIRHLQPESREQTVGVVRSTSDQRADAKQIEAAISKLPATVPDVILDACREMLEQEPGDRPTAMGLSRLGRPAKQSVPWHRQESMVGRHGECEKLFGWVEDVFAGDLGRFHITGPAGIGKTRLLDEVVEYIEEKNWGQVFRARCRLWEDHPLQAFDQICDAVANRYMLDDREVMSLDPVSVEVLKGVFPVLGSVLQVDVKIGLNDVSNAGADKFIAATRLTEQLRKVGPLFLVIDDSHRADRDTLNLLDQVQAAAGEAGLGIITASVDEVDPQRTLATHTLKLERLSHAESLTMIQRAADRWDLDVSVEICNELAVSAQGSPFRLQQLADEFRPGGAVASFTESDSSAIPSLDRIWKERSERLSTEARRVLTYVVTSGGYVSTQQLGELTSQGDAVDAALSELSQHGLVIDEATGGECITIVHDRVAGELIGTLPEPEVRSAHRDWASLLGDPADYGQYSARIAGHWFAANEPDRAVPHAIAAAGDAERRLAMTEAGRWYGRVIAHVDEAEKIVCLRKASRCYAAAALPVEASWYYQELSTLVDQDESLDCRLMATILLLRCGRLDTVHDRVDELAGMLGIPGRKMHRNLLIAWTRRIRRAFWMETKSVFESLRSLVTRRAKAKPLRSLNSSHHNPATVKSRKLDRQCQHVCNTLIYPMIFFDHVYAYELSATSSRLARKCGSRVEEIDAFIVEAALDCREFGSVRQEAEGKLELVRVEVEQLESQKVMAQWWAGIAYSHAFSCRWFLALHPAQTSCRMFQHLAGASGFEVAHMLWIEVWSRWFLGNWAELFEKTANASDDALRRSDFFQLALMAGGFGRGAWLGRHRTGDAAELQKRYQEFTLNSGPSSPFAVFDVVARIQECIYEKNFLDGWKIYQRLDSGLLGVSGGGVQLVRIAALTVGTLVALHQHAQTQDGLWIKRIRSMIRALRRERIPFALMLADFYEGLMLLHDVERRDVEIVDEECIRIFQRARVLAEQQKLVPYVLAAEDALVVLERRQASGLLRERMLRAGVVDPVRFEMLYTVPAEWL